MGFMGDLLLEHGFSPNSLMLGFSILFWIQCLAVSTDWCLVLPVSAIQWSPPSSSSFVSQSAWWCPITQMILIYLSSQLATHSPNSAATLRLLVAGFEARCYPAPARFSMYISTQNGSCKMSMCILTAQTRMKQEIWHRHLASRTLIEILYRDLAGRPLIGGLSGDLAKRPLTDLANRDPRVLVQRSCHKTSDEDLVQRPGKESSNLAQRSFVQSFNRDLSLRSLTKIFYAGIL